MRKLISIASMIALAMPASVALPIMVTPAVAQTTTACEYRGINIFCHEEFDTEQQCEIAKRLIDADQISSVRLFPGIARGANAGTGLGQLTPFYYRDCELENGVYVLEYIPAVFIDGDPSTGG